MAYPKILSVGFVLLLGISSGAWAEEYYLQYFLSKASSKTVELSKKEKVDLFNQLDGLMKQAQRIRTKLTQAIQTGEADVRYQEGRFWVSKLEKDQESIET